MKKDNETENQKRLKIDSETLRRLESEDLNVVAGGNAQQAGIVSLSLFQCGCSVVC